MRDIVTGDTFIGQYGRINRTVSIEFRVQRLSFDSANNSCKYRAKTVSRGQESIQVNYILKV